MSSSVLNDERISKLIDEIESRPPLYNKKLKDYLNNNLKRKLWLEVYHAVLDDWDERTGEAKLEAGKEIQDKWNGLRSCFSRELREQKSNKGGPKRRKYIFFERLSFLLPHTRPRCSSLNHLESEGEQGKEEPANPTLEPQSESHTPNSSPSMPRRKKANILDKHSAENHLMELLNCHSGINEDVTFALSLVPFLQRIREDKKIDARIEILQVLRHFTSIYHQPMVSNIQTVSDHTQGLHRMVTDPSTFGPGANEAIVPEMQPVPSDNYSEHSSQSDNLDIKVESSDK